MADNKPTESEGSKAAAPENDLSSAEASKLLMTGAALLQRHWLQSAVTVAKAMTSGQPVSTGSFDDLRRIREQFEELDRANSAITRIAQAQEKAKATNETEGKA